MNYDVIVIGGGPAGLSAALQARTRNQSVLVLHNNPMDDPLWKAEKVSNYLGLPNQSGSQLIASYRAHAQSAGVILQKGKVLSILPMNGKYYVSVGSDMIEATALVLATGVSRGKKYPGEDALLGRGVSYCATCDGMLYRGKDVVVVGLTSDSPEEANYLKEIGCRVTYVSPKPPQGLNDGIPFVQGRVERVDGEGTLIGLTVGSTHIPCQGLFILRTSVAPTELISQLTLDDRYVKVSRTMETNLPGLFAAGDCTGLPLQVSKAVGEGLVAGQSASTYCDQQKKEAL